MSDRREEDINPFAAPESDLTPAPSDITESNERGHATVDAGEVVYASWEIFKGNFGIAVGGMFIAGLIENLSSLPQSVFLSIGESMAQAGNGTTGKIFTLLSLLCFPLTVIGPIYIMAGQTILLLNIARGKQAQLGDLFSGGRYVWRMLGSTLLYMLMVGFGLVACGVPGIILGLMFGLYNYALIDRNSSFLECLSQARAASRGNFMALLLLFVAWVGINFLGMVAACLGLLVTLPLTTLFFAVAYCKMTGQQTAETL